MDDEKMSERGGEQGSGERRAPASLHGGGATGLPRRRTRRRRALGALLGVLALVVLAGAAVAFQVSVRGNVGPGVAVAGVALQGASEEAARERLTDELARAVEPVRLETPEGSVETTLSELGITVDVDTTAAAARAAGWRSLPFGLELWLPGGGAVELAVTVDEETLTAGLEEAAKLVTVPARDAHLHWDEDGELGVTPAQDGVTVAEAALRTAIVQTVKTGRPFEGPVPTAPLPPEVTTADVRARLPLAQVYLSRPVELRLKARRVFLQPEAMAGMLTVNRAEDADSSPLTFDTREARRTLRRLFKSAERAPVDARFVVSAAGRLTIEPSRDGLVLDMDELLADLDEAAGGGGARAVHVTLISTPPALSTEEAERAGLSSRGSQFVTYFDPSHTERVQNIARAAGLADGTVIAPGATFSLNATLGPRSVNRGFDYAPVIAGDGMLRRGVGGGICQYATTLFNAAFFAGLPIVERHPHGLFIDHYPVGRDATVSWGGPDLKFRNDTGKSLTVRSWVRGNALTVALVGRTGRTVEYTTSPFTDIRKPASTKADPRVISDAHLPRGVVRWERGAEGRTVRVTRVVKEGGRVLLRDTFVSTYRPLDWVKRVGTGD